MSNELTIVRMTRTPFIFVRKGVKVQGPQYCAILENKVLPWAPRYFGEEMWTYQQDGAPSHKSEETPEWIARNFPGFTSVDLTPQRPDHWPAISFDLDPLDYPIWEILESFACAKPH
ncbi:hypothetical protein ANCDUO_23821 [Ancylostoma duodenale]|uniref:Tc1-like transposase DDE domain-containing protein n=1 Tax=Ancylostoma duodenale TaxID=51022 RepID=A0A0C2FH98_9BILA|nr:hypothetical protein ANCDUO_23821 [Ancylostoma duodenale]